MFDIRKILCYYILGERYMINFNFKDDLLASKQNDIHKDKKSYIQHFKR